MTSLKLEPGTCAEILSIHLDADDDAMVWRGYVLAERFDVPSATHRYVTWAVDSQSGTQPLHAYWGRYFTDLASARADFLSRVTESVSTS